MNDLWQKTLNHLSEGNFSALDQMLGGPGGFDRQISDWHKAGKFESESEMLAEALSCACMLGRTETAEYLIDAGVDPYVGMKTWLAGPHYAVSGGHLDTVKMLIERHIPLEIENRYGGTMLGQALWSAVHEHREPHADIIVALIDAGAHVQPGTADWWSEQPVPSRQTKKLVASALRKAEIT